MRRAAALLALAGASWPALALACSGPHTRELIQLFTWLGRASLAACVLVPFGLALVPEVRAAGPLWLVPLPLAVVTHPALRMNALSGDCGTELFCQSALWALCVIGYGLCLLFAALRPELPGRLRAALGRAAASFRQR